MGWHGMAWSNADDGEWIVLYAFGLSTYASQGGDAAQGKY